MNVDLSGPSASTCGAAVTVAGVFTSVQTDTGRLCQRAAGHEGTHRWSASWSAASPGEVEAALAADHEKWDKPENE